MIKIWVMALFIAAGLFSVAWADAGVPDVMTIIEKVGAALEAGAIRYTKSYYHHKGW